MPMNKLTSPKVVNEIVRIVQDEFKELHTRANIKVQTTLIPRNTIVQRFGTGNMSDPKISLSRGLVKYFKPANDILDDEGKSRWVYTITLIRNHYLDFDPDQQNDLIGRMGEFFTGIGVEMSDTPNLLFTLLHEYGHVDLRESFNRRGWIDQFIAIETINQSSVALAFNLKEVVSNRSIYSTLLFCEGYADNFAMKKFLPIWNKVKHLSK